MCHATNTPFCYYWRRYRTYGGTKEVLLLGGTDIAMTDEFVMMYRYCVCMQWLKWGEPGGSAPLLPFEPPAIFMSPPDWIYKVLIYA